MNSVVPYRQICTIALSVKNSFNIKENSFHEVIESRVGVFNTLALIREVPV
jgi:hypothetical protein